MNDSTDRALAALLYGIESRKGIITVIGAPGAERMAVIDGISQAFGERAAIAYVDQPVESFDALLELVCNGFGIAADEPRRVRRLAAVNEFLLAQIAANRHAIILVEDADVLDDDVLEELRLLTNLETGKEKILQIVLAGTSALDGRLSQHQLRQLRQRVGLRVLVDERAADADSSMALSLIARGLDWLTPRLRVMAAQPSLRYGCALTVFAFGVPLTWALLGDLRAARMDTAPVAEVLQEADRYSAASNGHRLRVGERQLASADQASRYPLMDNSGNLLIGVGGVCGNGVVEIGEQCDDGNVIETDGCVQVCRLATCGDGLVQADVEDCDLGAANSNALSVPCTPNCRARN
jgi:cysteine-rich repeat protein